MCNVRFPVGSSPKLPNMTPAPMSSNRATVALLNVCVASSYVPITCMLANKSRPKQSYKLVWSSTRERKRGKLSTDVSWQTVAVPAVASLIHMRVRPPRLLAALNRARERVPLIPLSPNEQDKRFVMYESMSYAQLLQGRAVSPSLLLPAGSWRRQASTA